MQFLLRFLSVCALNRNLRTEYHPGVWNGSRWGCCKINVRNSVGCELCTLWLQSTERAETNKENSIAEESVSSSGEYSFVFNEFLL